MAAASGSERDRRLFGSRGIITVIVAVAVHGEDDMRDDDGDKRRKARAGGSPALGTKNFI